VCGEKLELEQSHQRSKSIMHIDSQYIFGCSKKPCEDGALVWSFGDTHRTVELKYQTQRRQRTEDPTAGEKLTNVQRILNGGRSQNPIRHLVQLAVRK
jgi:hypothetical protein